METNWSKLYQDNSLPRVEQVDLEPLASPDAWQIQCNIACLKRDKVPGPNQLPPALCKAGGEVLAHQLSILFTKTASHCREPLMWKGRLLVPLGKGRSLQTCQQPTGASSFQGTRPNSTTERSGLTWSKHGSAPSLICSAGDGKALGRTLPIMWSNATKPGCNTKASQQPSYSSISDRPSIQYCGRHSPQRLKPILHSWQRCFNLVCRPKRSQPCFKQQQMMIPQWASRPISMPYLGGYTLTYSYIGLVW